MIRIVALLLALVLAAPLAVAQRTGVKTIGGDWITLGDVAPVTGQHAGILLGPAPPAGQTLALDPAFLIATAKKAGVILAIPLDEPVMVMRATGNATPAPVANPARPANQIGGTQETGQQVGQVLVFLRDVQRGHVISSNDVNWEDATPGRTIRNGADMAAIGMEIRRPVKAGQPVLSNDLKAPTVIKKGEQVKIVYVSAGVRLTVDGVAQNEAAKGEPVRVLNSYSKRTIEAIAEAAGEARVNISR